MADSRTPRAGAPIVDDEGVTVLEASGGDWSEIAEEAARLGEERIVVNMGPQHPSTHGVLRLMLEIDGETVTEARCGIGYLHTGIEKNMEYRSWTQGTTFCTRMDYLAPLFQETAYCLAVEKLLGITDDVPERATVIRVLMMELNRISSHLVCLGTGGNELGATTIMTIGFTAREEILRIFELITGLRMNHAYIRPGGVAQDIPPGALDTIRGALVTIRGYLGPARRPHARQPDLQGPPGRRRAPQPVRLRWRWASPDRCCARPACPTTCARPSRTAATRPTTSRCPPSTDVGLLLARDPAPRGVLPVDADRRAGARPPPGDGGPARHGGRQEDRLARPARHRLRRHGQLARAHPADHGHLDGGADPPLQAGHRGLPGPGGPGVAVGRGAARRARRAPRLRRRHQAVPRALPRPVLQQPAGRLPDVRGRPAGRRRRRGRGPRPVLGGVDR